MEPTGLHRAYASGGAGTQTQGCMTSEPGLVWQTSKGTGHRGQSLKGTRQVRNPRPEVSGSSGKGGRCLWARRGDCGRGASPAADLRQPSPHLPQRPSPTAPGHAPRRQAPAAVFSEDCANRLPPTGWVTPPPSSYLPVLQGVGPTGLIWIGSMPAFHPGGSRREAVSHSSPASRGAPLAQLARGPFLRLQSRWHLSDFLSLSHLLPLSCLFLPLLRAW